MPRPVSPQPTAIRVLPAYVHANSELRAGRRNSSTFRRAGSKARFEAVHRAASPESDRLRRYVAATKVSADGFAWQPSRPAAGEVEA